MMETVVIIGIVLIAVGVTLGLVLRWFRRMVKQSTTQAQQDFPLAILIENARSLGQQSKGVGQIRGNGTLIVTPQVVVFRQWIPETDLVIPMETISGLEEVRAFLGKATVPGILKINFVVQGNADALGIQTANLSNTRQVIENQLRH